jgi:hypothetical protein
MARYYVTGALRELAGLPPSFPKFNAENGSPTLPII